LPVGDGPFEVQVATVQARMEWASDAGIGGFGVGVSTPLAVRPAAGHETRVPWTGRSPAGFATAMICSAGVPPRPFASEKEESDMDEPEQIGTVVHEVARPAEMMKTFTAAATGQGVVGPATTAGERTAVPLIETTFAGGYGGGGGSDSQGEKADIGAGGGGGGFGRSRTVAILEVAPDGVRVRPVIDKTAVILAGISAAVGMLAVLRRGRRRH